MARTIVRKISTAIVPFVYDFTPQLPSGASVTSGSEAATATSSAGTDVATTVIRSVSRSGNVVTVVYQAGTDYEDYTSNISLTMDTGEKLTYQVELRVRP